MRTREQRKLDSLARLLERNFTCAAVCSFNGKLFISTNKHASGSYAATNSKLLRVVESLKKGYFDPSDDIDLFENIVLDSVKASAQGKLTLDDDEIKTIAREMLSEDGLKTWGETTANDLREKYKTRSRASDAFFSGSTAERLAIDFFKVKQEFLDDREGNLLRPGLEVELLPASQKDVHAEMTILGKLIELTDSQGGPAQPVYIGISKKCCDRCMDVIKAFNQIKQPGVLITADDSNEESQDPEMTEEEILKFLTPAEKQRIEQARNEAEMILVSGSHAQRQIVAHYDDKKKKWISGWVKPDFLTMELEIIELENKESENSGTEENLSESDKFDSDQAEDASLADYLRDEYEADFPEDAKKEHQTAKDFDMDTEASLSPPPSPTIKPRQTSALTEKKVSSRKK
jgi:hypothetical protein